MKGGETAMARTGLQRLLRLKIRLDGELRRPDVAPLAIEIGELSATGLRFECNRATALALLPPRHQAPGLVTGVKVVVHFELPGLQKPVAVPCKLGLCRRKAQDRYCFECLFDPREHIQQQRIETFLRRHAASVFEVGQAVAPKGERHSHVA